MSSVGAYYPMPYLHLLNSVKRYIKLPWCHFEYALPMYHIMAVSKD